MGEVLQDAGFLNLLKNLTQEFTITSLFKNDVGFGIVGGSLLLNVSLSVMLTF